MTYEETTELDQNVKIKNEADNLYDSFLKNVKFSPEKWDVKKRRFKHWDDLYNATYFQILSDGFFEFQCEFLHETYSLKVAPANIFEAIKNKSRVIEHFKSAVRAK